MFETVTFPSHRVHLNNERLLEDVILDTGERRFQVPGLAQYPLEYSSHFSKTYQVPFCKK